MEIGVISTTRNVNWSDQPWHFPSTLPPRLTIQFEAEAAAAAEARIGSGAYSEGSNHGMASRPIAKKKLPDQLFELKGANCRPPLT